MQLREKTIAINRDWVYNQAYRLSHDISYILPFLTFDYLECQKVPKLLGKHLGVYLIGYVDSYNKKQKFVCQYWTSLINELRLVLLVKVICSF